MAKWCRKQLGAASRTLAGACSTPKLAIRRLQGPRLRSQAACRAHARPLLLDNYDSYTYNLYQIIAEAYGGACGGAVTALTAAVSSLGTTTPVQLASS
jgi:hypothetical protein